MATPVFTPEQEARINDLLVQYLAQNGANIDTGVNVTELTGDALTDENLKKLTIPSILPNTNQWAYTSLQNMMAPIQHAIATLQTDDALVQLTIGNAQTATTAATAAAATANTAATGANTAATGANTAAAAAAAATTGAEHVNAGIQGMTVTITDRNGTSRSVDIGFDIWTTYPSVAAMNADAGNVPQGKFVVIANSDPASQENARLYIRNSPTSQQLFDLLCDLDQASSQAWADWLNNMKPAIEAAITNADTAATNANSKASLADTAATNANTNADYAQTQGDYAKEWNDHPPYIADGTTEHRGDPYYMYLWDITTHSYVRGAYVKGADLDYSTMTPEEYARLVENVKSSILFATVQTCEDIIDELT